MPFDVISATLPVRTCCKKNGLYGTRTRDSGFVAREPIQKLRAKSASAKRIHPREKRKRGEPDGFAGERVGGVGARGLPGACR